MSSIRYVVVFFSSLALANLVLSTISKPVLGASPKPLKSPFDLSTASTGQQAWASHFRRKAAEKNSIDVELLLIPPGTFELGRSEALPELTAAFPIIGINTEGVEFKNVIESERPPHTVRLTHAFYMAKYNVTLAQFRTFVDDTGYKTEAETDGKGASGYTEGDMNPFGQKPHFSWRTTGFTQQDDSPVVNVTWNDANAFCQWLSKKEGKPYRLPSDAEWEYACRAGTTTRFNTGDNLDELIAVANVADIAYFAKLLGSRLTPESTKRGREMGMMVNGNDGYAFTSPVGKFKSNAFGLCDMHGNASTWCADWYQKDYYARSTVDNPQGPSSGVTRIVRGGNWQYYPAFCRSASRFEYAPSRRESFLGFRLVCELNAE